MALQLASVETGPLELLSQSEISDLCWTSAAGEEVAIVVAMERDVQHVGVIVENLLGAVAMVNVLRRYKQI